MRPPRRGAGDGNSDPDDHDGRDDDADADADVDDSTAAAPLEADPYAVLNVERHASDEQIKAAYKRLSMAFHPDRHRSGGAAATHAAHTQFQKIAAAYAILGDPGQRYIYDRYGTEGLAQGWAVGAKYGGPEALEQAYLRRARRELKELSENDVGAAGEIMIAFDATQTVDALSALVPRLPIRSVIYDDVEDDDDADDGAWVLYDGDNDGDGGDDALTLGELAAWTADDADEDGEVLFDDHDDHHGEDDHDHDHDGDERAATESASPLSPPPSDLPTFPTFPTFPTPTATRPRSPTAQAAASSPASPASSAPSAPFPWPKYMHASVNHAWNEPLTPLLSLRLRGAVVARGTTGAGVASMRFRHPVGADGTGEYTVSVGPQPVQRLKYTHMLPSAGGFLQGSATVKGLTGRDPTLAATIGRKLTPRITGVLAYTTNLAPRGASSVTLSTIYAHARQPPARPAGKPSLAEIGPNQTVLSLTAGLRASSVALEAHRALSKTVRATAAVSLSTAAGVGLGWGLERLCARQTVAGARVDCGTLGTTWTLSWSRHDQRWVLPLTLTTGFHPRVALVAAVLPVAAGVVAEHAWLAPRRRARRAEQRQRHRRAYRAALRLQEAEARAAVAIIAAMVQQLQSAEHARHGLVIVRAYYGVLPHRQRQPPVCTLAPAADGAESANAADAAAGYVHDWQDGVLPPQARPATQVGADGADSLDDGIGDDDGDDAEPPVGYIDVTTAVAYLVAEGKLTVGGATSKAGLLGFWDPAFGEPKQLHITYLFRDRLHQVTVDDTWPLVLPLRSHAL
ncbi:hypothetical protein CXG81DRAFT_26352 [Caulochytrium protostelioides]|uniref:J domain-containing protein n=1 Tax=Caulochytrium protostelioides TaxID=1555241 RepID=A0A4P9X6X7_9FUNG|nr:hypothetical protein CXG81DRAFT_26352 [Caulochytrium protostelioides]|eukprot:RKP00945.1 hypothetical protein CXG81DRAFT_26352 [Caulochytrium protostelioides]